MKVHLWSRPWIKLEKEMTTFSTIILAWKISWTEEPGVPQSMGSQSQTQVSDWLTSVSAHRSERTGLRWKISQWCDRGFQHCLPILPDPGGGYLHSHGIRSLCNLLIFHSTESDSLLLQSPGDGWLRARCPANTFIHFGSPNDAARVFSLATRRLLVQSPSECCW